MFRKIAQHRRNSQEAGEKAVTLEDQDIPMTGSPRQKGSIPQTGHRDNRGILTNDRFKKSPEPLFSYFHCVTRANKCRRHSTSEIIVREVAVR